MLRTLRSLVIPILSLSLLTFGIVHIVKSARTEPRLTPPVVPPRSPYGATIGAAGVVEPQSENIRVGAPLSGVILEAHITPDETGKPVEVGDPLFQVDDRHLRARLAEAEARLIGPQAELARLEAMPRPESVVPIEFQVEGLKAELVRATDELARFNRLQGTQAVSESQTVAARQAKAIAEAELGRAQAELDLLKAGAWEPEKAVVRADIGRIQAEINEIKTEIERSLVRAPISGVILQVNVRPGEYVAAPPTKDLIVLGDMRQPRVRVDIDESDIPRFEPGRNAVAVVRGDTDQHIPLQFLRAEPYVVPKKTLTGDNSERVDTRVLQVLYAVDAKQYSLYVGQQLDVFIEAPPRTDQEGNASAPGNLPAMDNAAATVQPAAADKAAATTHAPAEDKAVTNLQPAPLPTPTEIPASAPVSP